MINKISLEFFYFFTTILAVLTVLEIAWPSTVLAYINMTVVLILWLINASVLLISTKNN